MFGILFYSKEHILETKEYFSNLGLEVVEIRSPESSDWNKNPFKQKNQTWLSSIFRNPIGLQLIDHKIIVLNEPTTNSIKIYWRQVCSTIFAGNDIYFKESLPFSEQEKNKFLGNNSIIKDVCPACGNNIKTTDESCKECGLNLAN